MKPTIPASSSAPGNVVAAPDTWRDTCLGLLLRVAAGGWVPARWFERGLPPPTARQPAQEPLRLEIVSHCWQYAHLLRYQLSSLVRHPPTRLQVTMTVYYCPDDTRTTQLLAHVGAITVPNLTWHWCPLPQAALFRRAIGRNEAALNTQADWLWFTDCDLLFEAACLDSLATALQGRRDALVFPAVEYCTTLLDPSDSLLQVDPDPSTLVTIDHSRFSARRRDRATGPLQITHGDVARACGYCQALPHYQRPAPRWSKAYEDRAFRWLLRTQGTPLDIPGVYRIRHTDKGRYTSGSPWSRIRGWIRRSVSTVRERNIDKS